MKKFLILTLLIILNFVVRAQAPPATKINMQYYWNGGVFDRLHLPMFNTTPSLRTNQWTGSGAVGIDTVAHKFYFYSGGIWRTIGVPALTQNQIAFGDASNLMTSSANFQWIDATGNLIMNSGVNAAITLKVGSASKWNIEGTTDFSIYDFALSQYTIQHTASGYTTFTPDPATTATTVSLNLIKGTASFPRVAVGGTANASAIVDAQSTTQGFVAPRMTGIQQNAISSPVAGLLIYNTDSLAYCFYNGTAWRKIATGGGGGGDAFLANTQTFTGVNTFSGGFATTSFQTITSGVSSTVNNTTTTVLFNPASDLGTYTLTMPATPTDGQWIYISTGTTVAAGNAIVATFTLSPNSGQSIYTAITPTQLLGGDEMAWQYKSSNTTWYRKK